MTFATAITRGPGEGKSVWVPGHQVTCKARGEETGGAYSLIDVTIIGEGPPQHIHQVEDEAFYVLEGEVSVLRGDETISASPGAFVLVPRGTNHTIWNTGSTPARILGIYSPPGFEDYFLDTGTKTENRTGPPTLRRQWPLRRNTTWKSRGHHWDNTRTHMRIPRFDGGFSLGASAAC